MKTCEWCKIKQETEKKMRELIKHIDSIDKSYYCPNAANRNVGILWHCLQGVLGISYCRCKKQ